MRIYILFLSLCGLVLLNSCFDDDSTIATKITDLHVITVEGLQDTSAVAFNTVLKLTPTVKGFSDDELSFAWYIYGGQYENQTPEGYRSVRIGTEKTLSYPVEVKIGTYTIVCEVTHKKTGYFGLTEFSLNVTSAFSDGFYALKETVEGNSELDFYNHVQKTINHDLLTEKYGMPLPGSPRNMNTVYAKAYIDPVTATSTFATGIFVACGNNEFTLYNTTDMSKMFDRGNLLFSSMEADEVPYAMATTRSYNFYFSSKGVRHDGIGCDNYASEFASGQLEYPVGAGASTFVQASDGKGLSYWSESEHRLMYVSGPGYREIVYQEDYIGTRIAWDRAQVVASGWNHRLGVNTIWYMFDVAGEGRYLLFLENNTITEVRLLDASLNIAKADIIAGNGLTGNFIYSVYNNQMYRYSVTEQSESLLSVASLPAGTITYVSNLFYASEFDYIIIGVQNGDTYTVVMYTIQGGQPYGEPLHRFSGTGILKKICYAIPLERGAMPNYYAFTQYAELYGMGPTFPY